MSYKGLFDTENNLKDTHAKPNTRDTEETSNTKTDYTENINTTNHTEKETSTKYSNTDNQHEATQTENRFNTERTTTRTSDNPQENKDTESLTERDDGISKVRENKQKEAKGYRLAHIIEKHGDEFSNFRGNTKDDKLINGISEIIDNGKIITENGINTIWYRKGR